MVMSQVASGGIIIVPKLTPERTMPVIIPRLFTNHLDTVEIRGTKRPPIPTPVTTPKTRYSCQIVLMRDIKKKPRPKNKPQTVTTGLGPNLSVSLPPAIPKRAARNIRRLAAPESVARVQPNSVNIGSKKTPKLTHIPPAIIIMPKVAKITP
jgi:hypothetical protein